MADKIPIRGGFSGASLTGLAQFASGDTLGVAHGGTGIVTIGSNALVTGNGTSAMTSESNLTFDGTILKSTGDICATVKVVAPALCIGSEYVLPTADGSAGQLMCTDGSGALAFATVASTSPGGSDTYVQFNNSSAFGGSANLTWDDTTLATTAFTATGNVSLNGGSFVFNEAGADKDFRIEGDTEANLFFADASTDRIGIGTATPSGPLEVIMAAGAPVRISDPSASTTASEPQLGFYGSTDGATRLGYIGKGSTANNEFRIVNSQNDAMYFGTNDTERMRILAGGNVGIGTTVPAAPLHVVGEMRMNDNYAISWGGDQSKILGNDANDTLSFRTYNGDRLFITCGECSAVNIGIGTTNTVLPWSTPDLSAMLMVQSSCAANWAIVARNSNTSYNLLLHSTHGAVTGTNLQSYMESPSPAPGDFAGAQGVEYKLCEGTKRQVGSFGWFVDNICPDGGVSSHFYLRVIGNNSAIAGTFTSAGVWTDSSGEAQKEYEGTRQEIWPDGILPKIKNLNVSKYHAADMAEGAEITETHVSPSAENFWDTLGIGIDPRSVVQNKDGENTVIPGLAAKDLGGVALVAIQELLERVEAAEAKIAVLEG